MQLAHRSFFGFISLLITAALSGCGGADRPEMGYVSGHVTLDGEALAEVVVVMKPEVGRAAMSQTDATGFYDIEYVRGEKGTKTGPTTVSFEWLPGQENTKPIPPKAATGTSEIKLDVKPGKQIEDFALETEEGAVKRSKVAPD